MGREKGQEEHCEWGEEGLCRAGSQEEQGPLGFQGHDSVSCRVGGQGRESFRDCPLLSRGWKEGEGEEGQAGHGWPHRQAPPQPTSLLFYLRGVDTPDSSALCTSLPQGSGSHPGCPVEALCKQWGGRCKGGI